MILHQLPASGGNVLAFTKADVHHHITTYQYVDEALTARRIRFVEQGIRGGIVLYNVDFHGERTAEPR